MKLTTKVLLAGMTMMLCCSIGRADTIYYNDFTTGSSATLHGTAPTLANAFAGGSSSATWNVLSNSATAFMHTDGTIGANQNTALLQFTPQSGYDYTLTATLTFTAPAGSWVALGFASHNPAQNAGSAKLTDTAATGPDGIDWMIVNDATGNNEQFFSGPGASPGAGIGGAAAGLSGAGTFTLTLDLNTIGTQWSISSFINGIQLGTNFVYGSNPSINAIALGQNGLTASGNVQWDTVSLSATPVPEPSALALTGIGAAMLMLVRRQNKA